MADWKNLSSKAKNLTLAGLGKAKDLGESAKLNLDNVSEEENPEPPEGYEDFYRQMEEVNARIAANKERLSRLRD